MAAVDISKITGNVAARGIEPSTMLRAQLNRFVGKNPGALQIFPNKVPETGPIDTLVATRAGAVMIVRLSRPNVGDDPAADRLAAQVMTDPSGSVVRANLPMVIGIVAGFADANGLPEARLPGQSVLSIPVLVGGALVVGLAGYLTLFRKKR
jgi:hypothetical protein